MKKNIVLVVVVLGIIFSMVHSLIAKEKPIYGGVIIIAAGRVDANNPPANVDAITHATSKPGNTYIFAGKLAEELEKLGVQTKMVDFTQCQELTALLPTDLIIFASPTYGSKLPKQIYEFIPQIKKLVQANPSFRKIIYSSFTSCKYENSGYKAVNSFLQELQKAQVTIVPGKSFLSSLPEEELKKKTATFAKELVKAIK